MPTPVPMHVDITPLFSAIFQGLISNLPSTVLMYSKILISTWYIWEFLLLVALIKIGYEVYQYSKLKKSGIFEIDNMPGEKFEDRLQILFTNLGYKAERTSPGKVKPDYGADLVIEKEGIKTAVQAKRWKKSASVGEQVINDIYSALPMYDCQEGIVVTTSYFTRMAKEKAQRLKIKLWNRDDLVNNILKSQKETNATEEITSTTGNQLCPKCNSVMVKRSGKYGEFWGCSRFPSCDGTKDI
jgi:restriction system protein